MIETPRGRPQVPHARHSCRTACGWVSVRAERPPPASWPSASACVKKGSTSWGFQRPPRSGEAARTAGIPIGAAGAPLDLAFDGADAIDPTGLCVKGAGGAMVRERVIAESALRFIVLVDPPKTVASLDEWGVLPIAVVPFAADRVARQLADLTPVRRDARSDDGMVLFDLTLPTGADWPGTAERVRSLPGALDHGLFHLVLADVLIGHGDGSVTTAG